MKTHSGIKNGGAWFQCLIAQNLTPYPYKQQKRLLWLE
nr:MAG TPA: hypothetical protein [Caudoviricetes sp.]